MSLTAPAPRHRRRHTRTAALLLPLALWLAGCARESETEEAVTHGGATPVEAVTLLTGHLRSNDLAAFAHDAVTPDLVPRLDQAWREGRTRWPISELPLSAQLPAFLQALSAPQAEHALMQSFNRQFAGASRELHSAAIALGAFAIQYLEQSGDFSEDERAHYTQLVAAASDWAGSAPLADGDLARETVVALVAAAREGAIDSDATLGAAGMQDGLARLGPLMRAGKQSLAAYGLDLDQTFDSVEATLESQSGDVARVRMRYLLAGRPVDAVINVERHGGRWFISDFLRHAREAAGPLAAASSIP
ncbi:hypothetical protein CNR27_01755 [Luteimonas chenhongjianii]|uniref:Uncharacterized protein n=1 Tax=Luteimonas chenhongjianii TaxID=2006110 RepID=A0A290XB07_9GAMM|nr:hypothetical protein [Luteimonas chenhongjianii]ATD66327.1 hypothetical protein CNR27_01755 [Luteimonas chenhongjianii]